MNEIWLIYKNETYTYDISDIVSCTNSKQEAEEKIKEYEKICKQKSKIDIKEKFQEIRKSLAHIENDGEYSIANFNAQMEYINTIPFEEYLKYKCGKNAKFNKTTIQRSV